MSYRIGSLNCLNFGQGSDKDVEIFSNIIYNERFDIVALQEIKSQYALERILNRLPPQWTGKADNDGRVSDYAFIWNSNRIKLAEKKTKYGTTQTIDPHIYKKYRIDKEIGQKKLIREPYFARFFPTGICAPFIEIRIINTHIRFSKGSSDDSSDDNSLGAIAMRRNEFNILVKSIYAKESDERTGDNRPVYTILLGDYNLNKKDSEAGSPYLIEEVVEIRDNNTVIKKIETDQIELTTLKRPAETEPQNYGFSNNYDHFTYDTVRFDSVTPNCKRIDAVNSYCDGDFERYRKRVSDHVPIVMDLDLKK